MKFRYQNKYLDNETRSTIETVLKNAHKDGCLVSSCDRKRLLANDWQPFGVVRGAFYEGRVAFDAWNCWKRTRDYSRPFMNWKNIIDKGELVFPAAHVGLTNALETALSCGAIKKGSRHYLSHGPKQPDDVHHFVVTEYGYELDEYIRTNWGYA